MNRQRGFTLVELIIVMVITAVLAGALLVFFKPAMQNYVSAGQRATLSDSADSAMRRMVRDIRIAVPNSVRPSAAGATQCLEMLPTSGGGRFRMAADTVWDTANPGNPSLALDTNVPGTGFDVLTAIAAQPAVGDWVVIGNQSPTDVYTGSSRARITQVQAPPDPSLGTLRLSFISAQFPVGYDGGRFVVVPNAQQAVSYVCSNPGIANGSGTGTLFRLSGYGIQNNPTCPGAIANAPILATHVAACTFNFTTGATVQNGYVEIVLQLMDHSESVNLDYGAHVDNLP